jgi:hypothetical protein
MLITFNTVFYVSKYNIWIIVLHLSSCIFVLKLLFIHRFTDLTFLFYSLFLVGTFETF